MGMTCWHTGCERPALVGLPSTGADAIHGRVLVCRKHAAERMAGWTDDQRRPYRWVSEPDAGEATAYELAHTAED